MRVFIKLRQLILGNEEVRKESSEMRKQIDERSQIVFEALDRLLSVDEKPRKKITFEVKEARVDVGSAR